MENVLTDYYYTKVFTWHINALTKFKLWKCGSNREHETLNSGSNDKQTVE